MEDCSIGWQQYTYAASTCTLPASACSSPHLVCRSGIWVQVCWGGTVLHLVASSTMASASTRPKPYRWLTVSRDTGLNSCNYAETIYIELSLHFAIEMACSALNKKYFGNILLQYQGIKQSQCTMLVLEVEWSVPLCPAALVFQSSALKWTGLDVFTRRCCTSLHVSKRLQKTNTPLISFGPTDYTWPLSLLSLFGSLFL